jgi:hypothetical protein
MSHKRGGKKKKKKKKKKRKGRDWSYYDDYDEQPAQKAAAPGGRTQRGGAARPGDREAASDSDVSSVFSSVYSDVSSDVSSAFSDSDSDTETAYDALVSSSRVIAKTSSALYSKLLRQQQLEQAGKSGDSSSGEEGSQSESEEFMESGVALNHRHPEEELEELEELEEEEEEEEQEEEEQEQQRQEDVDDDDGDDDDDGHDDDGHGGEDGNGAEHGDFNGDQGYPGDGQAGVPAVGAGETNEDPYINRFQSESCDEAAVRSALELRQAQKFLNVDHTAGDNLEFAWQGCQPFRAPSSRSSSSLLSSSSSTNQTPADKLSSEHRLKPRVASRWVSAVASVQNTGAGAASQRDDMGFTPLQAQLFPSLNAYNDLFYSDRQLHTPTLESGDLVSRNAGSAAELRQLVSLHIVNHIVKARDAVSHHTMQIRRWYEQQKQDKNEVRIQRALEEDKLDQGQGQDGTLSTKRRRKRRRTSEKHAAAATDTAAAAAAKKVPVASLSAEVVDYTAAAAAAASGPPEFRDQGLSRCKVLVILPTRSCAERYVQTILSLLPRAVKTVHNKKRFDIEYGLPEVAHDAEGTVDEKLVETERSQTRDGRRRAEDWIELFARNDNDCFTLGMAFSRKEVKMYSDFNSSDLIVASPLGLRVAMGAEGEEEKKTIDADFLASIELLVIDQAEAFEMQNWEHLRSIMKRLNCMPRNERAQAVDFSRVRELDLLNLGRFHRQSIVLSAHRMPALAALCKQRCHNTSGVLRVRRRSYSGSIQSVVPKVRQIFRRIDCSSLASADDDRFDFFVRNMFPRLRRICRGLDAEEEHMFARESEQGTIIFVPSYFDFLRLRNLFVSDGLDPALCCEYTQPKDQTRNRSMFFHGRKRIMLYTERNHFYHRFRIRGARHIIFYGPPAHAQFYPDMLNVLSTSGSKMSAAGDSAADPSVTILFTKFDALRTERIVGTDRVKRMVKGKGGKNTYLFK